jgi:hypothetical protein
LLKETKADVTGFLQHFGVGSIDEIEQSKALIAINMLVAKKSKMKAKAEKAKAENNAGDSV